MQQPGGMQGLPQTGLQAQLQSLQSFYQQAAQTPGGGVSPQAAIQQGPLVGQAAGAATGTAAGGRTQAGQVNIQQLAKSLAQSYGLPMGRGELIDPSGNWLVTPEQLAAASGGQESMGMAAAKMNYISQAIANAQNQQQQQKGIAALQTGLGLVQSRERGSLAAMQSGFYEGLADLYANQEHEAADFTYFIEEERFRIEQEMRRKAEKRAKKKGILGAVAGIGMAIGGFATGNIGLGVQGVSTFTGGAGEAGWF